MDRAADEHEGVPRWVKLFGIAAIVVVVVVAAIVLAGHRGGPGRHLPSAGSGSQSMPQGGQAVSGAGAPAGAEEATRTVQVTTLDVMAFEPGRINASPGEAITFVVTNTGDAAHEFILGDAAMQQQRASQRAHMGSVMPHDSPNSLHLAPGETKGLTWRFGDAALEYACHEPGHYEAGMRGQVMMA